MYTIVYRIKGVGDTYRRHGRLDWFLAHLNALLDAGTPVLGYRVEHQDALTCRPGRPAGDPGVGHPLIECP